MRRNVHRVLASGIVALSGWLPSEALAIGPDAVIYPGCTGGGSLAPNDDGSSSVVALPFEVNFFNQHYNTVYINNNGNVTFNGPLNEYTPFPLSSTEHAIIAPFFADVDTRGAGSGIVHWGTLEEFTEGRDAFCVLWATPTGSPDEATGVGYYNLGTDKLNIFQLLLVDAHSCDAEEPECINLVCDPSDSACPPARCNPTSAQCTPPVECNGDLECERETNPWYRPKGDFDIWFNYDRILWNAGSASGGVGGLGGETARVGYASGTGPAGAYELEKAKLQLASDPDVGDIFTDGDASYRLTAAQHNSSQLGRYIHQVTGGTPNLSGGYIKQQVVADDGQGQIVGVAGAPVQICSAEPSAAVTPCPWFGTTDHAGRFTANGLAAGRYTITAFPPAGSNLIQREIAANLVEVLDVDASADDDFAPILLASPSAPPAGTTLEPSSPGGGDVPVVNWGNTTTLRTPGCAGGTATYQVKFGALTFASGPMAFDAGSGDFVVTVPPFYPNHGPANVLIQTHCGPTTASIGFPIYIDPSGWVRTVGGAPIEGATVTLLRSDTGVQGSFSVVPDGSAIMSPMNRENPSISDAEGHFGWDVITGYYQVRAEKPGCHAPDNAARTYVESAVMVIPPPVFDLDLRLDCGTGAVGDTTEPTLTVPDDLVIEATSTGGAAATFTVSAIDDVDGAVPVICTTPPGSALPIGVTIVHCYALDATGNLDYGTFAVIVEDTTVPLLTVPGSMTVQPAGPWGAELSFFAAAIDAVDGAVPVTCSPAPGTVLPVGVTTVTCGATDAAGNAASASFEVNIPEWVDSDADAVSDTFDNCPEDANPGQGDDDADGVGNACDPICVAIRRGGAGGAADAFISSSEPNTTSGSYPGLFTGVSGSGEKMGLVAFNLAGIPGDATIEGATFSVRALYAPTAATLELHAITAPWTEASVTYNTLNGAFDPAVEASLAVPANQTTTVSCDVTALVQDWVSGALPNHGVLVRELGSGKRTLRSSEEPNAAERPRLDLCYVTP